MQQEKVKGLPLKMFDRDLYIQIKRWRAAGERVILLMDVNRDPLRNNLYRKIGAELDGMEEFTHKCWRRTPPHTHAIGSTPINGGYISRD